MSPDPNAIWYGVEYNVSFNKVYTSNKPPDCDWSYAPIGRKGCYYKAVVSAFNAAGELVGGDRASNKRDLHATSIRVEWIKVKE